MNFHFSLICAFVYLCFLTGMFTRIFYDYIFEPIFVKILPERVLKFLAIVMATFMIPVEFGFVISYTTL